MHRAQLSPKAITPGLPTEIDPATGELGAAKITAKPRGDKAVARPVQETTAADRASTVKSDPGAAIAERVGGWGSEPELRATLSGLTRQEQHELRKFLLKNPERFLYSHREERLKNAAIHPAAHGPISVEKLLSVARGEPWTDPVDQSVHIPPALLHEVPTPDRALWAHRLGKSPELREQVERSPVAFGALATVGFDPLRGPGLWELKDLAWWQPATKSEARELLGDGTTADRKKVGAVASFFEAVAAGRGLPMAKALGVDAAASLVSERVRDQLTDHRYFKTNADRMQLIDRFGLAALKSLADESSVPGALANLRWYTTANAERAATVKQAIDREGGAPIAQALEQIVHLTKVLPRSGVWLLGMLSFAEARTFAAAAQDYSSGRRPGYGLTALDRLGANEIAARLRAGSAPQVLIDEQAAAREKAATQARREASDRLAKADKKNPLLALKDQALGSRPDLSSKLEMFALLERTHSVFLDNPLPSTDWGDRSVGPGSPLFERIKAAQREILVMIGKEEAPRLVSAFQEGPNVSVPGLGSAFRRAVWQLMDRLEPVADPTPTWGYGGLSLTDLAPVAALLPPELTDAFARAVQGGRPRLEIEAEELARHVPQAGARPFEVKHTVFRTTGAIRDLMLHLGEGIQGTDRRRMEAAFAGPFADARGPYLLAAFSDTGAKDPTAERLPKLIKLWRTEGGAWTDLEKVIQITPGPLGLSLELEPPFRAAQP